MKTAKELFEELGYERFEINDKPNGVYKISYQNSQTKQCIEFSNDECISIYNTCLYDYGIQLLFLDELQAINQQIKESGWKND